MELLEFTQADGASVNEKGVIRNVLILGAKSRNKREYKPEAIRKAAKLYEGVAVYNDHPTSVDRDRKGRAAADRFGVLNNVRFVEQGGGQLRGDLFYLTTHPLSARLAESEERGLKFFGLSHLADGTGRNEKGVTMVESIDKVTEVDLVTNPATATSLMEQEVMMAQAGPTEAEITQQKRDEAKRKAEYALTSAIEAVLVDPDMTSDSKQQKIAELVATHFKQFSEETKDETKETPAENAKEAKSGEAAEQVQTPATPAVDPPATPAAPETPAVSAAPAIDLAEQVKAATTEAIAAAVEPIKLQLQEQAKELEALRKLRTGKHLAARDEPAPMVLSEQSHPIPDPTNKEESRRFWYGR